MSNDLVARLSNAPVAIEGLDEDTLAVAGGANRGVKRISIKGGVFRKYAGGKEIGTIEDRHMEVIFVKMAHKASRMLYLTGYKEGEKVSPTCWSTDSETPDDDVPNPPSKTCSGCQYSAKGSGDQGMGTKCKLSWRTAVVLPNDPAGDVMQFVIPATSAFGKEDNGRWPFRPYIQHLASHNVSAGRVITKMQFDTKSPVPRVLFSPSDVTPDDDLPLVAKQAKSEAAEMAVKLNVYQADTQEGGSSEPFETVKEEGEAEKVEQPVKRESTRAAPQDKSDDVSDIVKKWSKKG